MPVTFAAICAEDNHWDDQKSYVEKNIVGNDLQKQAS